MSLYWYSNKVVLITGASKGIGRALAQHAATAGAQVVLVARSEATLVELAHQISQESEQVLAVAADVGNREQLQNVVKQAVARFGRIDVAVSNAGIEYLGPVESLKTAELKAMVDTHLFGLFNLSQVVLPVMRRQGNGTIVNVSAPVARLGFTWSSGYTATKAAADGFTSVLRRELVSTGIRVITIYPGPTMTEAGNQIPKEQLPPWHLDSSNKVSPSETAQLLLEAVSKGTSTAILAKPIRILMAMQRWVPALAEWVITRVEAASSREVKAKVTLCSFSKTNSGG